jgi:hypothetical protein
MNEWVFGLSAALFVVWMARHGRWALLAQAMEGNASLKSAS